MAANAEVRKEFGNTLRERRKEFKIKDREAAAKGKISISMCCTRSKRAGLKNRALPFPLPSRS